MRVLVSTGIFPNRGDMTRGVYVFQQVRALGDRAAVRVVAPVPYLPRWLATRRYRPFAEAPRRDTIDGIEVCYPRYVVIPRVLRFLHGLFVYACTAAAHLRIARQHRPDVVLSYFAYPYGVAAVMVARTLRLPAVVSCRGSDINHLARPFLHRRIISASLRRCQAVIAVSRALADEVAKLGVDPARIHVVPNGIDVERFAPIDRLSARRRLGLDAAGRWLVCVSRLSPEKGIDVLIDAMSRLRSGAVRLAVVGDGPAHDELAAQRDRLGLADRIELVGRRDHDQVPFWMGAADVVVLSSRSEGYPNAVVEALASGRPVVATRVGGVPDILSRPELGIIVEPEDPAGLAQGIEQALARAWDTDTLVRAARARTWRDVAEDVYRVLDGGGGR